MKAFDGWVEDWNDGMLLDDDDAAKVAYLSARAAWQAAQLQWQPIETAPQDGTKFLLLGTNNEISFCRWHEEVGAWCYGGLIGPVDHECLWMPLPQPPTS